jgi:nucleotide-binding universal stress UspA family protein
MGTHGYAGEDRLFLGSVTRNLLHKSPIPVLVVCQPGGDFVRRREEHPQIRIRQILLAHDLQRNNPKIRDVALSAARNYHSDVTFLYVAQRSGGPDWLIQEKQSIEKLRRLVNPEKENWCRIQFLVESGDSAESIRDSMERQGMDLLVMGNAQEPSVQEFFLDSLAGAAVVGTETPVLLVRSNSDFIGI